MFSAYKSEGVINCEILFLNCEKITLVFLFGNQIDLFILKDQEL